MASPRRDASYAPVSGNDPESFPSSFMKEDKAARKGLFPQGAKLRKEFCQPGRGSVSCFLTVFLSIGLFASLHLSYINGHLESIMEGFTGGTMEIPRREMSTSMSAAMETMIKKGRELKITNWNLGHLRTNPFEYWMSRRDKHGYDLMMANIENLVKRGEKEQPIHEVLTEEMFSELDDLMTGAGWPSIRTIWDEGFKYRNYSSSFMMDEKIAKSHLIIAPDEATRAVRVVGESFPRSRPSVVSMYDGLEKEDLKTTELWWNSWKTYMFGTDYNVRRNGEQQTIKGYQLLRPLGRREYPMLTVEDEAHSLPLQTLCLAVYDAMMLKVMRLAEQPHDHEKMKRQIVQMLGVYKDENTELLITNLYNDSDIFALQTVTPHFVDLAVQGELGKIYHVICPPDVDPDKEYHSVIFLSKKTFPSGATRDITRLVENSIMFKRQIPYQRGDVVAINATDVDGIPYVIASYGGDESGLATIPVLNGLVAAMDGDASLRDHALVFGLDASTFKRPIPGEQLHVMEFGKSYLAKGLTSCWGDEPQPNNHTTFISRTFCQPRLDEANSSLNKTRHADQNAKDFVLFWRDYFDVQSTFKDNSGMYHYMEKYVFPNLAWPSEHALVTTVVSPKHPQVEVGES